MWELEKAKCNNLMSFSSFELDVVNGAVTVIYGENKDNDSQKSNGSGKSAVLECIAMGITGSPLRKIKNGELVRNGEKSTYIEVQLRNTNNDEVMSIERVVYLKKSALVSVKINGELQEDLTTADNVNQFILDKIGIPKDDILNFFILCSSRFDPFLNASDTKKKEVINRFSNGDTVDKAIEDVEEDIALAQDDLVETQRDYDKLTGKIEITKESIDNYDPGKRKEDQIKDLNEELKELNSSLKNVSIQKKDKIDLIESLRAEISKLEVSKEIMDLKGGIDTITSEMDSNEKSIQELKSDHSSISKKIRELEVNLSGTVNCPKCDHEFDPANEELSIDNVRLQIDGLRSDLKKCEEQGRSLKKNNISLEEELSELEDSLNIHLDKIDTKKDDIVELEESVSDLTRKEKRLNKQIVEAQSEIESIESKKEDNHLNTLKKRLSSLKKEIKPIEKEREEISEEISELSIQKDYFRRFKTHLANKSIRSIELLANDYLESIGSDISIQLSAYKTLGNGKVRDKIDATLIRDGVELGSFNKNSNGEKARINLAFILTMNHLINLNAGGGKGLNLLIIDEILDASDAEGLMAMIRAMNKLEKTVLFVSHGALSANYEHSLSIVKEGGVSKIL